MSKEDGVISEAWKKNMKMSEARKRAKKQTKKPNQTRKQKTATEEYMKKSYSYLSVPEKKDIIVDVENISVEETINLIMDLLTKIS